MRIQPPPLPRHQRSASSPVGCFSRGPESRGDTAIVLSSMSLGCKEKKLQNVSSYTLPSCVVTVELRLIFHGSQVCPLVFKESNCHFWLDVYVFLIILYSHIIVIIIIIINNNTINNYSSTTNNIFHLYSYFHSYFHFWFSIQRISVECCRDTLFLFMNRFRAIKRPDVTVE